MIGENLKALEVAEEKAQQREEEYKKQIKVRSSTAEGGGIVQEADQGKVKEQQKEED